MLLPGINKKSGQTGGALGARVAQAKTQPAYATRSMAGMGDAPTGGGDPMRAAVQKQTTAPMKKSNKKFFGGLF